MNWCRSCISRYRFGCEGEGKKVQITAWILKNTKQKKSAAYPEPPQIFGQRGQVEVVDDDEISAGCAYYESVLVRNKPTAHQAGRVEHLLVHEPMLGVAVDVPREDGSVEAGGHQEAVFL